MAAHSPQSDAFETLGHPLLRYLDNHTQHILSVSHLGCLQGILGCRTGSRDHLSSHSIRPSDAGVMQLPHVLMNSCPLRCFAKLEASSGVRMVTDPLHAHIIRSE